jgi:hypothetical protein
VPEQPAGPGTGSRCPHQPSPCPRSHWTRRQRRRGVLAVSWARLACRQQGRRELRDWRRVPAPHPSSGPEVDRWPG